MCWALRCLFSRVPCTVHCTLYTMFTLYICTRSQLVSCNCAGDVISCTSCHLYSVPCNVYKIPICTWSSRAGDATCWASLFPPYCGAVRRHATCTASTRPTCTLISCAGDVLSFTVPSTLWNLETLCQLYSVYKANLYLNFPVQATCWVSLFPPRCGAVRRRATCTASTTHAPPIPSVAGVAARAPVTGTSRHSTAKVIKRT